MPQPKKNQQDDNVSPVVTKNDEENEKRHDDAPDGAPGGFHPSDARASVVEGKKLDVAIGDPLAGLTRQELVRLQTAVTGALDGYGEDPANAPADKGISLREQASALPFNKAATKDLDRKAVASKIDEDDEDQVLSWGVRQEGANSGDDKEDTGIGQAFLQAVTKDGVKHTVKL
jgi:hypothetical protein